MSSLLTNMGFHCLHGQLNIDIWRSKQADDPIAVSLGKQPILLQFNCWFTQLSMKLLIYMHLIMEPIALSSVMLRDDEQEGN